MGLGVTITRLAGTPGRPVVVLGPSLGTRIDRLWQATAQELGRVDEVDELEVLGWDLPGHGRTPTAACRFTIADLASAVLASVDAHLGAPARFA